MEPTSDAKITALPPGPSTMLGKYLVERSLAYGGMAEILLGRSPANKEVVLKRILPQYAKRPDFISFFKHEGQLGLRLIHPNIVRTIDVGESSGLPFIAMEYLRGLSLIELLEKITEARGELPLGVAVRMIADAARGLHHAHTANDPQGQPLNVIHRDVSPHNLFVCESGITKVLDFGIAKARSQMHHTQTGTIKGKFSYVAPEQVRGQAIDKRADVFSLGIVLYELLTLRPLFRGKSEADTLERVLTLNVPPPETLRPGVPAALGAVALRALQRDPSRRLPSCDALADSIEAVALATNLQATHDEVKAVVDRYEDVAVPEISMMAEPSYPSSSHVRIPNTPPPIPAEARSKSVVEGATPADRPGPVSADTAGSFPIVRPRRRPVAGVLAGVVGVCALGGMGLLRLFSHQPAPQPAVVAQPVQAAPQAPAPMPAALPQVVAPPAPAPVPVEAPLDAKKAAPKPKLQKGTLRFAVLPWADVIVDGQPLGTTPLKPADLTEGVHTVVLKNSDLNVTKRQRITITAHKETTLRVDLFKKD